jgi:glycosyltransferase involved in cell wall biosynthesis
MSGGMPALSIVIPTFNNVEVLTECLDRWRRFGGPEVEVIVVEDGCRDATPAYLDELARTPWGARHLRVIHEQNVHELRCTNRGLRAARGGLAAAWQDDMFLERGWFVPELIANFERHADLGLLSLSRGLNCVPDPTPIERWEDLDSWSRLRSTIGPAPRNWFCLQEVDIVIRPWVVRRACFDVAGVLDEAFVPTEWDEADLCFRIRHACWRIGTHGYERLGAYRHLGSTTLSLGFSEQYKARVLANGRLFHERWGETIAREWARPRRTWRRQATPAGWLFTARRLARAIARGGA